MKRPKNLNREQLEQIATVVQQALLLKYRRDGRFVYDAQKDWSPTDVCQNLAGVLIDCGLMPREPELHDLREVRAGDTVFYRNPVRETEVLTGEFREHGTEDGQPVWRLADGRWCHVWQVVRVVLLEEE